METVEKRNKVGRPVGTPRTPGSGRQAGTPNRTTAAAKELILNVLHRAGGEEYLLEVAQNDPKTFLTLLAKVLPKDINQETSGGIQVIVSTGVPRPHRPLVEDDSE